MSLTIRTGCKARDNRSRDAKMKHRMKSIATVLPVIVVTMALGISSTFAADKKPNIVFMLADNLGYGELGCYGGGILRGAPTPRIDCLATEGLRLLNFNVEAQCTPTRSALMTGRFSIRSGTYAVPIGTEMDGLTQWEVTIAQLLSVQGYATGIWGKWHLGSAEHRFPTHMGFDEWYGIPRSYDECEWPSENETRGLWPSVGWKQGWNAELVRPQYIYEARKAEKARQVKVLDVEQRRLMEAEITRRCIDFMQRQTKVGKPFFAYVSFSLVHMPTLPNPDFAGMTGNGDWADCLAEIDHRTGQILDAIKALGIEDNTLVIFASDNGPEATHPWEGWAGPWRGTYFTAMEGSLRTSFIVRWPGRVPAGGVSNEIVHIVDCFTTLARIGGAEIPRDRPIDGVDHLDFFLGKQEHSNREGFPVYVANRLSAAKWRNWKTHFIWQENMYDTPQILPLPKLINLLTDPKEQHDVGAKNSWVAVPITKMLAEFEASLKKYPPIPMGTPDPYQPPRQKDQ
jgi:arylsulfatase A-like enzyme